MRTIPLMRFDALAGYCRDPMARVAAEEIAWFEEGDESVLGALIRDRIDGDFGGIVLGRDEEGRFRWIGCTGFHDSPRTAKAELSGEMQQKATSNSPAPSRSPKSSSVRSTATSWTECGSHRLCRTGATDFSSLAVGNHEIRGAPHSRSRRGDLA